MTQEQDKEKTVVLGVMDEEETTSENISTDEGPRQLEFSLEN
jgi:hypothetical protein